MDRGSKSKRSDSDSDSGEGPSTREGTKIRDFGKQRAEEYEQRQMAAWKEKRKRLKKFNTIMREDDSQIKLKKYIEIQEDVVKKYNLKDLYVTNENNTNPIDIKAFKEINDQFDNYLKTLGINQELSKVELREGFSDDSSDG
jgi:hypothetical protein